MLLPKRTKYCKTHLKTNREIKNTAYKMKSEYDADRLIVSSLSQVYYESNDLTPTYRETNLKYFFEQITINGKTKYREVFTGFITDMEPTESYLVKPESFTDYFPETKGTKVNKLTLILKLNDINCFDKPKQIKKEFTN